MRSGHSGTESSSWPNGNIVHRCNAPFARNPTPTPETEPRYSACKARIPIYCAAYSRSVNITPLVLMFGRRTQHLTSRTQRIPPSQQVPKKQCCETHRSGTAKTKLKKPFSFHLPIPPCGLPCRHPGSDRKRPNTTPLKRKNPKSRLGALDPSRLPQARPPWWEEKQQQKSRVSAQVTCSCRAWFKQAKKLLGKKEL